MPNMLSLHNFLLETKTMCYSVAMNCIFERLNFWGGGNGGPPLRARHHAKENCCIFCRQAAKKSANALARSDGAAILKFLASRGQADRLAGALHRDMA